MTTTRLCAAVIGTGFIGPVHAEGLRRIGVDVAGFLGSTEARSQQAAAEAGGAKAYASLDELLADETVDAVHITSPNRFHYEQAVRCLESGRHVLCEKPLAMTSDESRRLVQLARQSGLVAAVNYNVRYYPLCLEAADRMRRGVFGEMYHVVGSYVQDWLSYSTDYNWRVSAADGGPLRAVADIGTHWLDLIQFISGRQVTAVCADLQTVFRQRVVSGSSAETFRGHGGMPDASPSRAVDVDTEDAGAVLLKFDNGSRGMLHVSQVTAGRKNCLRFELAGSEGTVAWDSEHPDDMWLGHRDQPGQALVRDPATLGVSALRRNDYPAGHHQGFAETFKQLFRDFYNRIRQQAEDDLRPLPSFADGHREVLLCEAILESHRRQSWVDVAME